MTLGIAKKFEVRDRGDGIEIVAENRDGQQTRVSFFDDDADALIEEINTVREERESDD